MTTRRKIWAGLTVFVVLLFTVIIPIHVIDQYPMMFCFLAGGLLVITLGQTIGDFDSIYELFEKEEEQNGKLPQGKKLAALAIIPGFIFTFALIFWNGGRKDDELKEYGVLTKGRVENGTSTTTTRRFQKNTSYDLILSYYDSAGKIHQFEQSVSGSEFNHAYQGQEVDIVYSTKHPSLAEAVLDLDELAKYIKIANGPIEVGQLISILESSKSDTIVNYLNTISYQWTESENGVYANEKRDLAIKVFPNNEEIAYLDNSSGFANTNQDFEKSMESYGFKKKAIAEGSETQELYYTEKYGVTVESKMVQPDEGSIGFTMVKIYHVFPLAALSSAEE